MFVGEYKHTIDEKNRIFIPSRLRSELGERFMVTKGFDRCLFVFPMAKWEAFAAKIAALPMVKNRRERLYFFSNAAGMQRWIPQGRVTVSPLLKEFAGIVKDVTVVGNDDRIELWAGEIWNEEQEKLAPRIDCRVAHRSRPVIGMEFRHYSVMLEECIAALNIKENGIYLDCTLGGCGHTRRILEALPSVRVIGLDRDDDAIANARNTLTDPRFTAVKANFASACGVLDSLGVQTVDGVLMDLGVSSYQLDNADRGFSYMKDAPLDMRMDRSGGITAYDVVNGYSEPESGAHSYFVWGRAFCPTDCIPHL